jgi:two-component system NarL family sensor kinase
MTTISQSEKKDNLANGLTVSSQSEPLGRAQRRLIWLFVVVALSLTLITMLLSLYYAVSTGDTRRLLSHQAMLPFTTVVFTILGALVVSRRPKNLIGWLFLIVGLFEGLSSFASGYTLFGSALWNRDPFPAADFAAWLNLWIWMPALFLPTTLILLLFPDGKLPSRRWLPVAWMTLLGIAVVMVSRALHPGPVESWGPEINPLVFNVAPDILEVALNTGTLILVLAMLASILALIGRFRGSRGVERQQIKWLVYAGMIMLLGFVVTGILWFGFPANALIQELSIALTGATVLLIGVGAGIAVARHNLYDIDLIINRTLVYVTLTAVIVALYALLVGGVGALLQTQSNWIIALGATVVVAILFQPLRDRLQKGVNRLLYGQRDEPFEVLSDLGQRLEGTLSPDKVFPTLVETVAETLKLPYVAISIQNEEGLRLADSYGRPVDDRITFPLIYQGEKIGQLEVAPRRLGESLSEADVRLLRNIAGQAGTAVHAVQLTSDLQRSRRELVTAREEERRRLRRDLHDGLGPSLAALHLQSGVLRRLIRDDPQAAEALANEFRSDIRATIDEIRRVVYELRPPALDELGLAAAVCSQAERLSGKSVRSEQSTENAQRQEAGLQVVVETPEALPPLPAAVEVAAYRIVQEALANVAHHALASQCMVRISMSDQAENLALQVEITDDGIGLNGRGQGLGLLSMRERAAELGGRCLIKSLSQGGTRVWASLPVS